MPASRMIDVRGHYFGEESRTRAAAPVELGIARKLRVTYLSTSYLIDPANVEGIEG